MSRGSAVEQTLAEAGDEPYEISVASDRASVAMRRYLKRRADQEAAGRELSRAGPSVSRKR